MSEQRKTTQTKFGPDFLKLDVQKEVDRLCASLKDGIFSQLRRRGAVVGISGGIDSSVVLALAVRALGAQRVVGILLPEKESSPDSATLAEKLAAHYGVDTITEDISGALEGAGCYQRRDEAVRRVFPEFGEGWKSKLVLPGSLLDQNTLNFFLLTVIDPQGNEYQKRLNPLDFAQISSASNFKQRTRMAMLYYHAELRNYAVVGTANKNEHALGFFVKYGDGGVDIAPILKYYKSQVYQLARYLGVPEEIQQRTPTSDTYSAGSTQEEFFFRLKFEMLDTIWAGVEANIPVAVMAEGLGLKVEEVERVAQDIIRKQRNTEYLRMAPITVEPESKQKAGL